MDFPPIGSACANRIDNKARNAAVLDALTAAFQGRRSVAAVDLACGTGATLRAIGARLPQPQHWRLVDNDLSLLARAAALGRPPELTVEGRAIDISRDLEAALDGPLDLVTASALLDLVSAEWLERLIVEAAARRLPVYAALSYDGRAELAPVDPFDADMLAAFNRHQRINKGFGPALGPDAPAQAAALWARVGYGVVQGRSDWEFTEGDRAIQSELFAGWAASARELPDLADEQVAAWLERRQQWVAAGRSRLRIGHVDVFAAPTATR